MSTSVLIVDDHPMLRTGLRAVLGPWPGLEILGEATTGEGAVKLAEQLRPEVVVCDLRLGDGMDGVSITAALRALTSAPAISAAPN